MRTFFLAGLAALSMAATSAAAGPVIIDSFASTNFQVVGAPTLGTPPLNPATTSGPTADAIGGVRTITAERTFPAGTGNAFGRQVQATVTNGVATVSLGVLTEGFAVFSWNAGGADLIMGSNDGIYLDVDVTDLNVNFAVSLDGVSVSQVAPGAGTLFYAFSDFAGLDPTSVSAISLTVSGPQSFETTFSEIYAGSTAAVPLPASGLLILAGLGALRAARRRKRG